MTPAIEAVYEELLVRASEGALAGRAREARAAFTARTGAFPQDHPGRPARDAAAWEDALVRGGLAAELAAGLEDPSEQGIADVIARAQRGLFQLGSASEHRFLRELWRGGAFALIPRDDVARGEAVASSGDALLVARIVAGSDGCAVLPGRLWLPADATPLVVALLPAARERGLDADAFLDALLRMEHALATMSRVKAAYAFRPAALDRHA